MPKARIIGLGCYLPERVLSNRDLEKMVDTSDEWIVSRTGIQQRRIAAEEEMPSDMGFQASRQALEKANVAPSEIDLILVATMTPDYLSPSTAVLIQHRLEAVKAAAIDVGAACTGFIYALSMAKAYIESKMYRTILVVAAEKMSSFIDYKDRNTCVLFGDGAGAAVVSDRGDGFTVDQICLGADGSLADLIKVPGGGARHPASIETVAQNMHFLKMMGKEVFKQAVKRMSGSAKECLELAGVTEQQIRWLIPHQANDRIIESLGKTFEIAEDRIYKTVHKYGNTSASSILIAFTELTREKELVSGDHFLLVAFGGGLTWGAVLLTKI